jgi:hypothetical protein
MTNANTVTVPTPDTVKTLNSLAKQYGVTFSCKEDWDGFLKYFRKVKPFYTENGFTVVEITLCLHKDVIIFKIEAKDPSNTGRLTEPSSVCSGPIESMTEEIQALPTSFSKKNETKEEKVAEQTDVNTIGTQQTTNKEENTKTVKRSKKEMTLEVGGRTWELCNEQQRYTMAKYNKAVEKGLTVKEVQRFATAFDILARAETVSSAPWGVLYGMAVYLKEYTLELQPGQSS